MKYCPPNVTLSDVWMNHGVSLCFMDTISSSILFGYVTVFGLVQHYLYRKYATSVDRQNLPQSVLFKIQIVCTLLLPSLALVRLLLQGILFGSRVIYGYMVITACFQTILWPTSLSIVMLERRYLLPSVPTRGHGLMILVFWTLAFVNENLSFLNLRNEEWWFDNLQSLTSKVEMSLFVLRYLFTLALFILGLQAPGLTREHSPFTRLSSVEANQPNSSRAARSPFYNFCWKIKKLGPFLWPKKAPLLQFVVLICLSLLAAGRVVNLMTPIYYKHIVDSLTTTNGRQELLYRWDLILVYIGMWFLQGGGTGGSGGLNNLRSFLWIRVQQFTTREVEVHLFSHLHRLSLRWHLSRKTGEVLKIMDRGVESANTLLSYLLFSVLPTIADVLIAIIYFVTSFNAWFGLILFITMVIYLTLTIWITDWRTKYRRELNQLDNVAEAICVDSLLNFETVKYYNAEGYEIERFRKSVIDYQVAEWKSSASLNLLNLVQNFIMTCGLLSGTLLCAHMIVNKQGLTVGDYVLFATYTLQFYAPLNWFGTYYRMIQRAFIDMENMFDLLHQNEEVQDIPYAPNLALTRGRVEFKNVSFSYTPEKPILKDISFVIQPGETLAFVGPTGSGKSTVVRLLFRLYDIQVGNILIDNQNIAMVTQHSVRRAIGVVPQDTVLFNTDIRFNIRYGDVTASDEEVEKAAIAAEIHNSILGFPDGYSTVVGERGLKLSGGEKQRVAIARTILKSASIMLLDEATSALDTQTERNIQASLSRLCANKTTLMVAHRLSTIIHAHQICVLKDGEIIERGTHEELLGMEGEYTRMWNSQLKELFHEGKEVDDEGDEYDEGDTDEEYRIN